MITTRFRVVESPVGPITLAGVDGALTSLRMHEQRHEPARRAEWVRDERAFPEVVEQLAAYFDGSSTEFDIVLRLGGTPFQRCVWAALLEIPYGETESYGALATRIGHPTGARAVGLANGRNPVGIIVPCHRVVGASGALTGYGGGIDRKRALLDLEANHRRPRLTGIG